MEKVDQPKGLVRYTTEHQLKGGVTHIFRFRILVYAALLLIITGALVYSIATRIPLEVDIIRDRNALYFETDEGYIENVYTLKVINMSNETQTYKLSVSGIEDLVLENKMGDITVESGAVVEVPVRIQVDPDNLKSASSKVDFTVESITTEGLNLTQTGRFLGPTSR
jgi:polyferredoxin